MCNSREDASFWPTRLIDVGCRGLAPRLITTRDHIMKGHKYLTLSHCWGSSIPANATTKSGSLPSRLNKLPLRALPRTFKDAIRVTRKLGIPYIWIDSLCIVQDSRIDWQRESALMGKVYANCFCMLAAGASKDCHGGLFRSPERYPVLREPSSTNEIGVLLKLTTQQTRFSELPLNTRGWTLQERELPHRILHFANDTICFECREGQGFEGKTPTTIRPLRSKSHKERHAIPLNAVVQEPLVPTKRFMDPIFSKNREIQWAASSSLSPSDLKDVRYTTWRRLVEDFSRRTLSFPTDKFPAISGLAAEFSYLLKDEYVAGLWKEDLSQGLSWMKLPTTPKSAIQEYGPSWSWAKVCGPVTYDLLSASHCKQFEGYAAPYFHEVFTVPEGDDPNGTLKSAFIRMKAEIAPLMFHGRTTWHIGIDLVEIVWDSVPDISQPYFLLLLVTIPLGLVVTVCDASKRLYSRVGIAPITERQPGSWSTHFRSQEITLI